MLAQFVAGYQYSLLQPDIITLCCLRKGILYMVIEHE